MSKTFINSKGEELTLEETVVQLMKRVSKLEETCNLHNKVMRQILNSLESHTHV